MDALLEDLRSIPITHVKKLTTACDSNSWVICCLWPPQASLVYTYVADIHIIKRKSDRKKDKRRRRVPREAGLRTQAPTPRLVRCTVLGDSMYAFVTPDLHTEQRGMMATCR